MFASLWRSNLDPDPAADAAVDAPAPAPAPPPVAAAPVPAGIGLGAVVLGAGGALRRGKGRGKGFVQSDIVREKCRSAALKMRGSQRSARASTLRAALCPPLALQTVLTTFGLSSSSASAPMDVVPLPDGAGGIAYVSKSNKSKHRELWKRGLLSFVKAVWSALPRFIGDAPSNVILSSVMDDCSVWVRRSVDSLDPSSKQAKHGEQHSRMGRNVCRPAFNCVQHLVVTDPTADAMPRACAVHTPTQILPRGNWSTIYQRWTQWAVFSGRGIGKKLRSAVRLPFGLGNGGVAGVPGEPTLISVLSNAVWRVALLTMESLVVNKCIVCEEQRTFGQSANTLLLDVACHHHCCALGAKPLVTRIGDGSVISNYIRLAHLLESSRTFQRYVDSLDAVVGDSFRYRAVEVLLAECVGFMAKSRRLLESTRVALDIDDAAINEAVSFDNSNWEDEFMTHYCVPTCSCFGNQGAARTRAKQLARRLHGGGMCVPLLYRFKHMERTSAQIFRGRQHHKYIDRSLARMYPDKARRRAVVEAEGAQAADVPFHVKQGVRANKVLDHFQKDSDCRLSRQVHFVPGPLHYYMNACFKAEGKVTVAIRAMAFGSASADALEALDAAFRANAKILSGAAAVRVQAKFAEKLCDWSSAAWQELELTLDEKYDTSLRMLCGLGDSWRRLSLPAIFDPRFILFGACHMNGMRIYNEDHIRQTLAPLQFMQATCGACVDKEFTGKLLGPLLARLTSKSTHRLLCTILTILRVSSASVERSHLPAEESKPVRSRGRALNCVSLSGCTYRRFVVNEFQGQHDRIEAEVLKKHGLSKTRYSACLRSDKLWQKKGSAAHRTLGGHDLFRTEQWSPTCRALVGSPEFIAEQGRILAAWTNLPVEGRQAYHTQAKAANDAREEIRGGDSATVADVDGLGLSAVPRANLLRDLAQKALRDIADHPAWSQGMGLMCPSSALPASAVVADNRDVVEVFRIYPPPAPSPCWGLA